MHTRPITSAAPSATAAVAGHSAAPTRTTIGYVMNRMHTGLTTDRRVTTLATAITTAVRGV